MNDLLQTKRAHMSLLRSILMTLFPHHRTDSLETVTDNTKTFKCP